MHRSRLLFLACTVGTLSLFATEEVEKAAAARDAALLTASRDAAIIKKGKETYVAICQACHGDEKTKIDAPSNLFDEKWFHGGRPSEIEHSVLEGFLEKGMPPWKDALPPEDTTALTAYLLSFQKK